MKTTTIYLIHFDKAYKHAAHYLGSTANLDARIAEHKSGHGARLLQVIIGEGISFEVVRTWPGSKKEERALKNHKHAPRLCPVCSGEVALQRGKLDKKSKQ